MGNVCRAEPFIYDQSRLRAPQDPETFGATLYIPLLQQSRNASHECPSSRPIPVLTLPSTLSRPTLHPSVAVENQHSLHETRQGSSEAVQG